MTDQANTTDLPPTKAERLNELRTLLALDQTLLAWDRTALTLIGCGFTLAKYVQSLMVQGAVVGIGSQAPRHLGICLMCLGVLGIVGGIYQYVSYARLLPNTNLLTSGALIISVGLALIAIVMTVTLLFGLNIV